eukprot:1743052-Ditylum_brightwellii.AAC.1
MPKDSNTETETNIMRHVKHRAGVGDGINSEQMRCKRARLNYDAVSLVLPSSDFAYMFFQSPLCAVVKQRSSSSFEDACYRSLHYGSTPLHHACEGRASLNVLSLLLREWPDAAKEKDALGKTPLHCACEKSTPLEVISLLLKAYPEAAEIKDNDGKIPLHYECENGASRDI